MQQHEVNNKMAVNASSAGLTILLSSNAVFAVKKKKRHREENEIKRGGERERERERTSEKEREVGRKGERFREREFVDMHLGFWTDLRMLWNERRLFGPIA